MIEVIETAGWNAELSSEWVKYVVAVKYQLVYFDLYTLYLYNADTIQRVSES